MCLLSKRRSALRTYLVPKSLVPVWQAACNLVIRVDNPILNRPPTVRYEPEKHKGMSSLQRQIPSRVTIALSS